MQNVWSIVDLLHQNRQWWNPVISSAYGVNLDSRMLGKIFYIVDNSDITPHYVMVKETAICLCILKLCIYYHYHHSSGTTVLYWLWPPTQISYTPVDFGSSLYDLGCSSSSDFPPCLLSSIFLVVHVSFCHRFIHSRSFWHDIHPYVAHDLDSWVSFIWQILTTSASPRMDMISILHSERMSIDSSDHSHLGDSQGLFVCSSQCPGLSSPGLRGILYSVIVSLERRCGLSSFLPLIWLSYHASSNCTWSTE